MNIAYNMDCLEAMKEMKDNEFDLAIVDPPYGIGNWVPSNVSKKGKKANKNVEWNEEKDRPSIQYFDELRRVSKNQIIWGLIIIIVLILMEPQLYGIKAI